MHGNKSNLWSLKKKNNLWDFILYAESTSKFYISSHPPIFPRCYKLHSWLQRILIMIEFLSRRSEHEYLTSCTISVNKTRPILWSQSKPKRKLISGRTCVWLGAPYQVISHCPHQKYGWTRLCHRRDPRTSVFGPCPKDPMSCWPLDGA